MKKNVILDPQDWINDVSSETKEMYALDDILYDLSVKLVEFRFERNLKQKDLAKILDVTQAMVSKLESGEYNPTVELLWKISKKIDFEFRIVFKSNSTIQKTVSQWKSNRNLVKTDYDLTSNIGASA